MFDNFLLIMEHFYIDLVKEDMKVVLALIEKLKVLKKIVKINYQNENGLFL